ncbi:MAG: hypothetical protein U9R68_05210, partial [Planctomycetota bacterium]|nr:hypothetical protein [Planctomycetota bacterium]
ATFGGPRARHPGTLTVQQRTMRFDLTALPADVTVQRAVLRVPLAWAYGRHEPVRLVPVGVSEKALPTQPPTHTSLNATEAVRAWAAEPAANHGLRIDSAGRADLPKATLEVSYLGDVPAPLPQVTHLTAEHHDGQTFLRWREPEDVVGREATTFAAFEKAVMDARARRRVTCRVYRHTERITPANLGAAEIVCEVPEAISCWNLLAIANTEHPQKGETKRSPLREGNLRLDHVMTRFRLRDDAPPLPPDTGLAVLTANEPGTWYYAVSVAVDGREAAAELTPDQGLAEPVRERPARFPAIVYQRTREPAPEHRRAPPVDVYVCWLEPPLVHKPRPVEVYRVRWPDLPPGSPENRRPLYVNLGTYGGRATQMSSPGWHAARRYVPGAVTIALAEEGTLWAGDHECLGTLRGLDEGVVWNHEQRRVLAATAWAVEKPDLFVDPERVVIWGQFAGWALRHGDVFTVVMSNGHNTFKTSREGRKHYWRWGAPDHDTNWLGTRHLDYLDLAAWVRASPQAELPYWVCAPAYGAFPDHTLGDFGFKPWQEFLTAMAETRRAFAAVWLTNGPGLVSGIMRDMVPQIRLHQSLPAFSNCSLDTSPLTDQPKGSYRPGRYDQDFQKHADKEGGINLYQRWDTADMVDETDAWAVTVWLAGPDTDARYGSPAGSATMDVTPRRCRRFTARPGDAFRWTNTAIADGNAVQSGTATAGRWGLVTVKDVRVTKAKRRIRIARQGAD